MAPSNTTPRYPKGTDRFNEELHVDYVDESHVQAFAVALMADELAGHDSTETSPAVPNTPMSHSARVRKVSALSDFAPVNLKVKRRKKRDRPTQKKQDYLFLLLRWPLLFFIFVFIAGEFGFYILIRQLVNTKEWLSAWRGRKGVLRQRLRAARTYQDWKSAAETLDEYLQFHEWKKVDEDPFYDWKLVRKVRRSLKTLREKNDVRGLLGVLETCIRTNFAGVESPRLYSETFLGTKDLIESYIDEQEKALEYIRETTELSNDEKKRFFKTANTNLGVSALCLSGGASFGYYHFGVMKAFLDAGLLPRVITGTSAGGLVAALVCTRTDEELRYLLVPEIANRITACEEPFQVWFKRFWTTGARFDSLSWARKCTFFTRGSMTFKEAYLRTGRILNISVIPADRHSPTKLLNYLNAPDTVIWTALLASAAVPGILNPVVLMQKLKDGRVVPWNWGSRFKDGSLRVDIPIQALNLYFNVTHPVVSQVNPHVHLFFFAPRGSAGKPVAHRKGKGWRGNFLLSAAEQWLKHELTKNFKVIRDLELLPQILGTDWSSVFLQRFDGSVTIWPRTQLSDWLHILSDPDPPELQRMIRGGEIVTWPKLHMIENRFRLEKQVLLGRQAVRRMLQSRTRPISPDEQATAETREAGSSTLPRKSATPAPTGSDHPLSVDTDAETAFTNGTHWLFKRGRITPPSTSGVSTPRENGAIPQPSRIRTNLMRRKWAVPEDDDSTPRAVPRATPVLSQGVLKQPPVTASSDGFFVRLRSQSFPSLKSSLTSLSRNKIDSVDAAAEEAWSSESSSEGDLDLGLDARRSISRTLFSADRLGEPAEDVDETGDF